MSFFPGAIIVIALSSLACSSGIVVSGVSSEASGDEPPPTLPAPVTNAVAASERSQVTLPPDGGGKNVAGSGTASDEKNPVTTVPGHGDGSDDLGSSAASGSDAPLSLFHFTALTNTLNPPAIAWTAANGATAYDVKVYSGTSCAGSLVAHATLSALTFALPSLSDGLYAACAQASLPGSQAAAADTLNFSVDHTPPGAFLLALITSPFTGATVDAAWGAANGADEYAVWLSASANCSTQAVAAVHTTGLSAQFTGVATGAYYVCAEALDHAGNSSPAANAGMGITVFGNIGQRLWTDASQSFDTTSNLAFYANLLAADAAGDTYVAFTSSEPHASGCTGSTIRKIAANGAEITAGWCKSPHGPDGRLIDIEAMTVAANGDLIVAGSGYQLVDMLSNRDVWMARYHPDGSLASGWPKVFDGTGVNDYAVQVAVAPDGSVYLLAKRGIMSATAPYNASASAWWTKKFNAAGSEVVSGWDKVFVSDVAYPCFAGSPKALAVDSSGDVYLIGENYYRVSGNCTAGGTSAGVITAKKYHANGTAVAGWSRDYPTLNPPSVAIDSGDNLYYSTVYGLKKYASDGTEITSGWAKAFSYSPKQMIALDASDHVYVARKTWPVYTTEIHKYAADGSEIIAGWNKSLWPSADDGPGVSGLVVSPGSGALMLSGLARSGVVNTSELHRFAPTGSEDGMPWPVRWAPQALQADDETLAAAYLPSGDLITLTRANWINWSLRRYTPEGLVAEVPCNKDLTGELGFNLVSSMAVSANGRIAIVSKEISGSASYTWVLMFDADCGNRVELRIDDNFGFVQSADAAFTSDNGLYVLSGGTSADYTTSKISVRKFSANGAEDLAHWSNKSVASNATSAVAVGGDDQLYVAYENKIAKFAANGARAAQSWDAALAPGGSTIQSISGLGVDAAGHVYVLNSNLPVWDPAGIDAMIFRLESNGSFTAGSRHLLHTGPSPHMLLAGDKIFLASEAVAAVSDDSGYDISMRKLALDGTDVYPDQWRQTIDLSVADHVAGLCLSPNGRRLAIFGSAQNADPAHAGSGEDAMVTVFANHPDF